MATHFEDIDQKDAIEHHDVSDEQSKPTHTHDLKSEFDTYTVRQILWRFRKAIMYSVIIGCTALADGYAGNVNG
jgi:hypothetical protein